MLEANYLIINKKARIFSNIRYAGRVAVFFDRDNKPVNYGVLSLDETIYAIMCCDEHRALSMVIDNNNRRSVKVLMWKDEEDYRVNKKQIAQIANRRIYVQDCKFSSYAWLVAAKLDEGNRVRIVDAIDESKMEACPECGILNPPGSRYCLDCGAELK